MKITETKTIIIEAEYGSEFQKECAEEAFDGMLLAYKMAIEGHHKNNKIVIKKQVMEKNLGGENK